MHTTGQLHNVIERNKHFIREWRRISFSLGINVTSSSNLKDSLRIVNLLLTLFSCLSLYGHWCVVARYWGNIREISEGICTAIQTLISIVKMLYMLFAQKQFAKLLHKAVTHQLLQEFEVFEMDLPMRKELKLGAEKAMHNMWKTTRAQLIFYLCCCTSISSHYFFSALLLNTYHQWNGTIGYVHRLPFPATYDVWADKGMSFPYYHIQMLLTGSALYISGMCAVSFDGLFVVLCLHCVGLIDVLKLCIPFSTSPMLSPKQREEYLRSCIYQYHRIQGYMKEVNQMFKHISITQFMLSLVVWAIVLFQISIGLESDIWAVVPMLMYISAAGFQIVIYCHNGQRISTANKAIPLAFYSCAWYDQSHPFQQFIQMMLLCSNREFEFHISWFSTMSLGTLMAMLKASGSYFLLLRDLVE